MTRIFTIAFAACFGAVTAAGAATEEELDRLVAALGTPVLMELMRAEGLASSEGMEADLFGARGGNAAWDTAMDQIYDVGMMTETFRSGFDEALMDVDVAPLLEFYETELGQEVVALELAGREAFLDEDVEAAAEEAFADLDDAERLDALTRFIEQNDIVELNVMGGMNSNLAFFEGMADGGFAMSQDQMLSDVWSQEGELRAATETWIFSYLNLAYEPLSPDDLETYISVAGSDEGRAMNRALFDGFDQVFIDISRALGRAAAIFGQSEEL